MNTVVSINKVVLGHSYAIYVCTAHGCFSSVRAG